MKCDTFPDEPAIANAVFSYSGDIYTKSDVVRFLGINDIDKPNTVRFLSWLIGHNLIPSDRIKWIPEIFRLSTYYERSLSRYISDAMLTPLETIDGQTAGLIRDTVHNALPWFLRIAKAFHARDDDMKDVELRMQRIFVVAKHEARSFVYEPGYEYFAYFSYLVAYCFAMKGGLPLCFAEAMGSHIARSWIGVVSFNSLLDSLRASEDHTQELIRLAKKYCPNLIKNLSISGRDFMGMCRKWEGNLFADLHTPWNLLLIWDQILFHWQGRRGYIRLLIIGHFRAMMRSNIDFSNDEAISDMQWNAMQIIADIEDVTTNDAVSLYHQIAQMVCPCFPFLQRFM